MLWIQTLWSKVKTYVVAALGVLSGVLYISLRITAGQKKDAQERAEDAERKAQQAEARVVQRHKAEAVNQQAKAEGEKHVQDAIDRARSGDRSHFE